MVARARARSDNHAAAARPSHIGSSSPIISMLTCLNHPGIAFTRRPLDVEALWYLLRMSRRRRRIQLRGLFWNVNSRHSSATLVADLVKTHGVDVLVLAEPGDSTQDTLNAVVQRGVRRFVSDPFTCDNLQIFHRLPVLTAEYDDGRMSIRRIRLGPSSSHVDLLLVAVHLPSKLHLSSEDQAAQCIEYVSEIRRAETRWQTKKTLVVGDFNMNPYEHGMVQTTGFHSVMNRRDALRGSRIVQGRRYDFFYNPMWRCFGNGVRSPSGTYWKAETRPTACFWHIFDQVLVRPELVPAFDDRRLQVITLAGSKSLLGGHGRPISGRPLPNNVYSLLLTNWVMRWWTMPE